MKKLVKPSGRLSSLGFVLRSALFPERCAICDRLCSTRGFCESCKPKLVPYPKRCCARCGLPQQSCECAFYFYYFKGITAPFLNRDEAKTALYAFKFRGALSAAPYFAQQMASRVRRCFGEVHFNLVTAVPMSRGKLRQRGYNQAEVLARLVAAELSLPYSRLLRQNRKTKEQHFSGTVQERFENAAGKYGVRRGKSVAGKTVLLVDDIKTTGATLNECTRQLLLSGAEAVYCTTALITIYEKSAKENHSGDVVNYGNQHSN